MRKIKPEFFSYGYEGEWKKENNFLGVELDDPDAVARRIKELGYRPSGSYGIDPGMSISILDRHEEDTIFQKIVMFITGTYLCFIGVRSIPAFVRLMQELKPVIELSQWDLEKNAKVERMAEELKEFVKSKLDPSSCDACEDKEKCEASASC